MAQVFNPSIQEAEIGVLGQPGLHGETLFQKQNKHCN